MSTIKHIYCAEVDTHSQVPAALCSCGAGLSVKARAPVVETELGQLLFERIDEDEQEVFAAEQLVEPTHCCSQPADAADRLRVLPTNLQLFRQQTQQYCCA